MIEPSTPLRRKSDVRFRHIPPETLVIRQAGPEVLVLNGVAGRILELLDRGATAGELVEKLGGEYSGDAAVMESEAMAFLEELVTAGVLEVAGA
jgi:hypothetical protein